MGSQSPVAVVTGAGSGIGAQVASLLSERGFRLVLVGRRADRLHATGSRLKGESLTIGADLSRLDQPAHVVQSALARYGRIDALVNNAGDAPNQPIEKHTPELIQTVFAVNAVAPASLIAAAWPALRKQATEAGRATIVNVSSMATVDPYPGFFAYAGAKAAVNLLARAAHNEGKRIGIRAFAVAPGAVETEMLRANFPEKVLPRSRTLEPGVVAAVIAACVLGERDAESGGVILVPSP